MKSKSQLAAEAIQIVCDDIKALLLEKNASYGNSAFEPIGIMSKGLTAEQQICVRIDDKLSRLQRGSEYPGDDTMRDLAGYLLLKLAQKPYQKLIESQSTEIPPLDVKAPKGNPSKRDAEYWRPRLVKRSYMRNGKKYEDPFYSAQIQWDGGRRTFRLHKNHDAAARVAALVYQSIESIGIEKTLERFSP